MTGFTSHKSDPPPPRRPSNGRPVSGGVAQAVIVLGLAVLAGIGFLAGQAVNRWRAAATEPARGRSFTEPAHVAATNRPEGGSAASAAKGVTGSPRPPEAEPPGQKLYLEGRKLFFGEGVAIDRRAAFTAFQAAAEKGHPVACTFVAASLVSGWGGNAACQYEKADAWNRRALPRLRRMALLGDPDAQLAYGELLIDGNVEPLDENRGRRQIERAAEAGHPPAMVRHALNLAATAETDEAKKDVIRILQRAVDMGSVEAVTELGKAYEKGVVVDRNDAEAYRLLRQAAMKDDEGAVHALAHLVLDGRGTTKDEAAAVKLFERALAISPTCGCNNAACLARCYFDGVGVAKNPGEGLRILMTVSETNPAVQLEIANRIDRGDGVQQDTERATDWFKKSFEGYLQQANRGNMGSAVLVGKFLADGVGVEKDRGEARRWFERARKSTDKNVVRDATVAIDALDRAGTSP